MKSSIRSFLCPRHLVLAVSSFAALPLPAADPAAVLPDESIAYMEMDGQAGLKLVDHPVIKLLPVNELKNLMYKMSNSSPEYEEEAKKLLAAETGVSYEELEKKAGRMAVSLHDLKIPENPTPDTVNAELSVAYEFDADEAFMDKYFKAMIKLIGKEMERQSREQSAQVKEMFGKFFESFEQTSAEHGGAKIHLFKLKETDETKDVPAALREWAYAVHDKMFLFASGQDQVEEMIDRMKSGGEAGSLAASAYYKRDHDCTGKSLTVASLHLEPLLAMAKDAIRKQAGAGKSDGGVNWLKVFTVLGADKLQSAVVSISAAPETIDFAGFLTYSEKPGLLAALALPGSGAAPAFLPKGLQSAGYQQIDFGKTFENIEKLAGEIDPRASEGIAMALSMAQQKVGVDLRKDIINQLGPDVWLASLAKKGDETKKSSDNGGGGRRAFGIGALEMLFMGGGGDVVGIRLRDPKVFELALKTIFNKVAQEKGLFETREYQGFTINNVKGLPAESPVAWLIAQDWLILSVGPQGLLEQILARLGKSGDDGYFAQKNIARHLDAMRGGQAATGATDIGSAISDMLELFEAGFKQGFKEGSGGAEAPHVPFGELAKLLNVPLLSLDKAYIDDKHLEYRARIAPKGD